MATITGLSAAVMGVPPRQKVEVTIAAVSEARLATISVCGDSFEPPSSLGRRSNTADQGSEHPGEIGELEIGDGISPISNLLSADLDLQHLRSRRGVVGVP